MLDALAPPRLSTAVRHKAMDQQPPAVSETANEKRQGLSRPTAYLALACVAAVAIPVVCIVATHCSLAAPAWVFVLGWISAAAVGIVCDVQILDLCDAGTIEVGRRIMLRLAAYLLFAVHCGSLLLLMFLCAIAV